MLGDSNEAIKSRLQQLRDALLRLHKILLESEQSDYEHEVARIESRNQLLGLLINDPRFAWLRQLSSLIVTIDELRDAKEPASAQDADRLIKEARTLLTPLPAEEATGFGSQYYKAMQRDPGVILAHAEIGRVFARLTS